MAHAAAGYPNDKTVHRRLQHWYRSAVLRDILVELANTLRQEGALDVTACFIDASFAPTKRARIRSG